MIPEELVVVLRFLILKIEVLACGLKNHHTGLLASQTQSVN
jgi:hypothetical protein